MSLICLFVCLLEAGMIEISYKIYYPTVYLPQES
jgi:hypothetical protein